MTEFVGQLNNGSVALKIDDSIGVLRDRSVGWIWNAFMVLKNKELVKKVCLHYLAHNNALNNSPLHPGF